MKKLMKKLNIDPKLMAQIFLFLAAVCWSLCGLLVKSVPWDGLYLSILRGSLTFFIFLWIKHPRRIYRHRRLFGVELTPGNLTVALCYFMQTLLFILANKYTAAGCATALQNTSPIYILILSVIFYRKKPEKLDIITCVALCFGIMLTMLGGLASAGLKGNVMALLSGIFYACVFFFSGRGDVDSFGGLLLGNFIFVLLLPVLFLNGEVMSSPASYWILAALSGLLSGSIGWMFFSKGIVNCEPLRANFITMCEPVMSPLWTFLFLHEVMPMLSIIGCVTVIATLLLYNYISHKLSQAKGG